MHGLYRSFLFQTWFKKHGFWAMRARTILDGLSMTQPVPNQKCGGRLRTAPLPAGALATDLKLPRRIFGPLALLFRHFAFHKSFGNGRFSGDAAGSAHSGAGQLFRLLRKRCILPKFLPDEASAQ
jgi:hypothetical protein